MNIRFIEPSFSGRLSLLYKHFFYAVIIIIIFLHIFDDFLPNIDIMYIGFTFFSLFTILTLFTFFSPKQVTIEQNTIQVKKQTLTITDYDFSPLVIIMGFGIFPTTRKLKLICRRTGTITYISLNGYSTKQVNDLCEEIST